MAGSSTRWVHKNEENPSCELGNWVHLVGHLMFDGVRKASQNPGTIIPDDDGDDDDDDGDNNSQRQRSPSSFDF